MFGVFLTCSPQPLFLFLGRPVISQSSAWPWRVVLTLKTQVLLGVSA